MTFSDKHWDDFIAHNIKKNQHALAGLARIVAKTVRLDHFLAWITTDENIEQLRELATAKQRIEFFETHKVKINEFAHEAGLLYGRSKEEWFETQCNIYLPVLNPSKEAVTEVFIKSNKNHPDYLSMIDKVTINIVFRIVELLARHTDKSTMAA